MLEGRAFDKLVSELHPACMVRRPVRKEVITVWNHYFLLASYHSVPEYGLEDVGYTYAFQLGDVVLYREPAFDEIKYDSKIVESREPFVIGRDQEIESSL